MADNHLIGDEFVHQPQPLQVDQSQDFSPEGPINHAVDDEVLKFRFMLMQAKAAKERPDPRLADPSSSVPNYSGKYEPSGVGKPRISNTRLDSVDPMMWHRRQQKMRQLKDLNFVLLGIAVGSVLLLAAVVIYMYMQ